MAINRNALLKLADKIRPIKSPINTTRVTIRRRVWPAKLGVGTPVDTDILLPQYISVREIEQREVASSGGLLKLGDAIVGPITPRYPTGGFTVAQIAPEATDAVTEIIYVLSGGMVGDYRRIDASTDKAFRYMLTLRKRNIP